MPTNDNGPEIRGVRISGHCQELGPGGGFGSQIPLKRALGRSGLTKALLTLLIALACAFLLRQKKGLGRGHHRLDSLDVASSIISQSSSHYPAGAGCLGERFPHPVTDRESASTEFGYPPLASTRMLRDEISMHPHLLDSLNGSAAVGEMRSRPSSEKCVKLKVPRKLHYVWFGGELPGKYVRNVVEMATNNTGWEVFLWGEVASDALRDELGSRGVRYNFRNITRHAEDGLLVNADLIAREENLAGKADYMRLEAVFLEGGIYQDTDAHAVQPFNRFEGIFSWPFLSFDPFTYQNACNCVFGFEKGSKFLEFALQLTRENCIKYNSCGVMNGAGPGFVTAALYFFDDPDIVLIDQLYMIRQWYTPKSVTWHSMDATWRESYCKDRDC